MFPVALILIIQLIVIQVMTLRVVPLKALRDCPDNVFYVFIVKKSRTALQQLRVREPGCLYY